MVKSDKWRDLTNKLRLVNHCELATGSKRLVFCTEGIEWLYFESKAYERPPIIRELVLDMSNLISDWVCLTSACL